MSIEISRALQDCINTSGKLKSSIERDSQNVVDCLGGELMKDYLNANAEAKNRIEKIQKQLSDLQILGQKEM